jgi:hypothetical protein
MRHALTERQRELPGDMEICLGKDGGLGVDEQFVLVLMTSPKSPGTCGGTPFE